MGIYEQNLFIYSEKKKEKHVVFSALFYIFVLLSCTFLLYYYEGRNIKELKKEQMLKEKRNKIKKKVISYAFYRK